MLISIIVKITAQCTSNFVDGKEWLPLPVLQGTPRTRPRRSVAAVVYGPRQPQRQETQVVEGEAGVGGGKKRREKNKTGRRWIAHCVGWPRVVYCVGKFGGMFKQRNELVDKHHYGYLASTLDATTRICLPTSCTGSWTNIFGPTTRCRTRRGPAWGFGLQLGASSSSSSSLDFVPSCQIICCRLSVGVLFEVDLVI